MASRKEIFFLIFILFEFSYHITFGQDSAGDAEQKNLKLCFTFSKLLNCEIDTIADPVLFQTVYDWLGTPYKYSGDCREGVDCSGFVGMLYKTAYGISLSPNSAAMYKEVKPLKKNALEEGDLVFFKIRKHKISHVGIYLGNNKFAHASVQNGVTISDLDEPYYKKYFFKGGRVKK